MRFLLSSIVVVVLAILVLGLGLLPVPISGASEPQIANPFATMRAEAERSAQLDEGFQSAHHFRGIFNGIESDLWLGKVSPFEAADQVRWQSWKVNPIYVEAARSRYSELSEREAVLAVILEGMQTELALGGASP